MDQNEVRWFLIQVFLNHPESFSPDGKLDIGIGTADFEAIQQVSIIDQLAVTVEADNFIWTKSGYLPIF